MYLCLQGRADYFGDQQLYVAVLGFRHILRHRLHGAVAGQVRGGRGRVGPGARLPRLPVSRQPDALLPGLGRSLLPHALLYRPRQPGQCRRRRRRALGALAGLIVAAA